MTDAPERIFAWQWALPYPSAHNGKAAWSPEVFPTEQDVTEYVRADVHAAALAEVERLREAVRASAKLASLVEFLQEDDGRREAFFEECGPALIAKARAALEAKP